MIVTMSAGTKFYVFVVCPFKQEHMIMNQTIIHAKLARWLIVACIAPVTGQASADGVAVVPGKANGYFYDTSSNQTASGKEISLVVKKEGHFKEYIIETLDGALRCDKNCPETSQRIPAGSVSLRIVGKKPVSFIDIPLKGIWSEPCSNTQTETAECVFSLNELNGKVTVEVSPDIKVGTTLSLPDGTEGLIIKVDIREGYILLAAHEKLGEGRRWLSFNPNRTSRLNINSPVDGRINSQKLLGFTPPSEAAKYCAEMEGGGWYLPAEKELALMTKDALNKVSGLEEGSYLWSSTESGLTKCEIGECGKKNKKNKKPTLELTVRSLSADDASIHNITTYKHEQETDGRWTEITTNRYQSLCFRRVAF